MQQLGRRISRAHGYGFRKFEFDVARIHVGRAKNGGDIVDDSRSQLAARNVDADAQLGKARGMPLVQRFARMAQDPRADRHDESAALRHRDEDVRHDEAALGMMPSHERFGAVDAAVREVDLRLEEQFELVARHGEP